MMDEPHDSKRRPGEAAHRRLSAEERRENEVRLLLRYVRGAFFTLITIVTLLNVIQVSTRSETGELEVVMGTNWWIPLSVALGLGVVVLSVDLLTPNKRISSFSGVIFGLLIGVLTAFTLGFVVDLVATSWEIYDNDLVQAVKVLAGICLCYLAVAFVMQTKDDIRLVIPYVEFAKQIRGQRPLILDTSALIDGRLIGLTETGLVQAPLIIPRFVLGEMQRLSDSDDKAKRARGRRGLDIVSKLQRSARADVTIDETVIPGNSVDPMLVELARRMSGVLVTTDTGLGRVAAIEGVGVVNLHDVASAMRPSVVPGERLRVKLVKPGEQPGQAVGYLEDGTMIVAEDGGPRVGEEVDLFVSTSLQTSAGRLIFARTTAETPNKPVGEPETPADHATDTNPEGTEPDGPDTQRPDPQGHDPDVGGGASEGGGPHVVRRAGRNPRR